MHEELALAIVQHIGKSDNITVLAIPSQSEIAEMKGEARELDPSVALPALIKLWLVGGQQDFIVSEWWRKQDNAGSGRMLIVALFLCARKEPISGNPQFGAFARRFAMEEQKVRLAEIESVMRHREMMAQALVTAMEKTGSNVISKEASDFLSLYRRAAHAEATTGASRAPDNRRSAPRQPPEGPPPAQPGSAPQSPRPDPAR